MGVHLREADHKDEVGRDMEISLWWWDPLWFYICENCADVLSPEQAKNGYMEVFMSEGVWIAAEQTTKIADRLKALSAEGKVEQYEKRYSNHIYRYRDCFEWLCHRTCDDEHNDLVDCIISALPYKFSKKFVAQFAKFSRNSGGFAIC